MKRILIITIWFLLASLPAKASDTILGTPGGFLVPTTETTERGKFAFQLTAYGMAPFMGIDLKPQNSTEVEYEAYLTSNGVGASFNYSPAKGLDMNATFFNFKTQSHGDLGSLKAFKKTSFGRVYGAKYALSKPYKTSRIPSIAVGFSYFIPDNADAAFGRGYAISDFNIGERKKKTLKWQRYTHAIVGVDVYTGKQDLKYIEEPSKKNGGIMLAFYEERVNNDNPHKKRGVFVEYASTDFLSKMQAGMSGSYTEWAEGIEKTGGKSYMKQGTNSVVLGVFTQSGETSIKGGILLSNRGIDASLDTNDDDKTKKPLPFTWFLSGSIGF